jgi:DNA-binding NtrC family response regulator
MHQRILVVDDEEAILFAMREYFTAHGYQVDCAPELEKAKVLLALARYTVVIADLQLTGSHGSEGLELVEYICKRWPSTRVILLTAYGSPDIEREARRRGADAFLRKQMPLSQIAHVVFKLPKRAM